MMNYADFFELFVRNSVNEIEEYTPFARKYEDGLFEDAHASAWGARRCVVLDRPDNASSLSSPAKSFLPRMSKRVSSRCGWSAKRITCKGHTTNIDPTLRVVTREEKAVRELLNMILSSVHEGVLEDEIHSGNNQEVIASENFSALGASSVHATGISRQLDTKTDASLKAARKKIAPAAPHSSVQEDFKALLRHIMPAYAEWAGDAA